MAQSLKSDRAYFWSNSFVHPKTKSKFLIEFGGLLDSYFNGKYSWLVKSVNRPKFSAEFEDFKNTITYNTTSILPKAWNWEPITIKFVNPFGMSFWPADLKQDFDLFFSNYIQDFRNDNSIISPTVRDENNRPPTAVELLKENEILDKTTTRYYGRTFKIYDISMGYQSPGLGTGGGVFEGNNSNSMGLEKFNDINNPTLTPLELALAEMYLNGYWEIKNPYLIKVEFGDNDYSSDEFVEISLTFKFQDAIYTSNLHKDQMAKDPDKFPIVIQNALAEIDKASRLYKNHEITKEQYESVLGSITEEAVQAEAKSRPKDDKNNAHYNKQRLEQLQTITKYKDESLTIGDNPRIDNSAVNADSVVGTAEEGRLKSVKQEAQSYYDSATNFSNNPNESQQVDQTVSRRKNNTTSNPNTPSTTTGGITSSDEPTRPPATEAKQTPQTTPPSTPSAPTDQSSPVEVTQQASPPVTQDDPYRYIGGPI